MIMLPLRDVTPDAALAARDKRRFDTFVPNYLIKRIRRTDLICSAGCGTGYDVELLCALGYNAYGFDPGARSALWSQRPHAVRERLKIGRAEDLPWGRDRFDFVYALEVIEHVGCEDGQWKLLPDYMTMRREFLASCLDMLKPGGRLLLSTSNRLCPLDIGHGHHYSRITDWAVRRTRLPLTIPWHRLNFVLSYEDIRRLLLGSRYRRRCRIEKVAPTGYLAYSRLNHRLLKRAIDSYLKLVSLPFLRASLLSPLLIVEITRL